MGKNRIAKIVINKTDSRGMRYARVMYRGKCLMTRNIQKQLTPCDFEDVENAEIEAYKACRQYALDNGFTYVERIYE